MVKIKVVYNQSGLWSRLHTTLAHFTRITPKWIYTVLNIFSPFRSFEQLALALKNRVCLEYIFYQSGFLSNLCLPWKTEFALKFFTVLNILLTFRILRTLRLPWNTGCALNSLYWKYIFYQSEVLSNLRLPWKTECALNSLYWICFLTSRIFEQFCFCPENRVCPECFYCIEYIFYIQDFEQLALALKTASKLLPGITTIVVVSTQMN